ncbi:hypothetical protein [Pontibacter fetidus]|uniref:Uncharacterized protein n=1 Tax=Pontibacter fetidus TaxID=2700082 RepID=A0A6B2H7X2_9BACT|nr:hypothetical protein [Pontibacter fetidus]NDK57076.1 hypothetical protein [Pontibacter fetidus]
MEKYTTLLDDATKKLIELGKQQELVNELLSKAPPVLWFGNNLSPKEKIVTIGANPSREEFLKENKFKAQERLNSGGNLEYIDERLSRFKVLSNEQDWTHILENPSLKEEIFISYNDYFKRNPYKWFGKKASGNDSSYNVEGFINALDGSYYEGEKRYQCLHIDLMPFPTISDFTSILVESEKYIFKNDWARNFLDRLITEINPNKIIVFGRTNLNYLTRFWNISNIGEEYTFNALTENGRNSSSKYWIFDYKGIDVIGLSVNLGNPKGFSKKTLSEFGKAIKNSLT